MKINMLHPALCLLAFMSLATISCNKDDNSGNNPGTPPAVTNVYVAGTEINSAGKNVAKYWKNGQAVILTNGSRDAVARSIFVSGNDVYVAGFQDKAGSVLNLATYWKNGTVYTLGITGGPFDAANSIFVSGDDVYAAGFERASNGNDVAKYWKNGTPYPLTDGSRDADAQSIIISGTDVYVAGSEAKSVTSSKNIAKYWKNGVAVPLTDGSTNANAHAISVVGADVYVAGTVDDVTGYAKAVYWKNGVQVSLSGGSQNSYGFCLAITGSDIYVGGRNKNLAIASGYWKNDLSNFHSLPPASTYDGGEEGIGGLVVSGTNIYAAGSYKILGKSQAVYWKNGTAIGLGNPAFHSSASAVFAN